MNSSTVSTHETSTCRYKTCSEPRTMNKKGKLLKLCSYHRELVCKQERERAQARRMAKNGTSQSKKKKKDNGKTCLYRHQKCSRDRSKSLAGTLNNYCEMHQEKYREYARKFQENCRRQKEREMNEENQCEWNYEPLAQDDLNYVWSINDIQEILACLAADDDKNGEDNEVWPLSSDDIHEIYASLAADDDEIWPLADDDIRGIFDSLFDADDTKQ